MRRLANIAVPVLIIAAIIAFWSKPLVLATGPNASAPISPYDIMKSTGPHPVEDIEDLN